MTLWDIRRSFEQMIPWWVPVTIAGTALVLYVVSELWRKR